MATNEENKRLELLTKYTNWIKKSKLKLLIVFIIYCTVLLLNFLFFKNGDYIYTKDQVRDNHRNGG